MNATKWEQTYRNLAGTPVCAVLKDGTVYCGTISSVVDQELILQGFRCEKTVSRKAHRAKAQISGLGLLGGLLGGGANPGAAAGGGLFGRGLGGWFRIGLGVVQFLLPLMGRFVF